MKGGTWMAIDTSCNIGTKKIPTPLLVASGQPTGEPGKIKNFAGRMAETKWGGIVTKTIACEGFFLLRPHLWKSSQYGLSAMQNYGPTHSILSPALIKGLSQDVSACHREGLVIIASCEGGSVADTKKLATEVAATGVDGIEINMALGHIEWEDTSHSSIEGYNTSKVPDAVRELISAVTESVNIPVIPKFTAHLIDPVEIAQICMNAGAAGISATNTLRGIIGIDVNSHVPLSRDVAGKGFVGGISGAVIKPVALAMVADIVKRTGITVYGIGGVIDWVSGVEFLLVGSEAFQVCTGVMTEGFRLGKKIYDGLIKYMEQNAYQKLSDFRGGALKHLSDDPHTQIEAISVIDPKKCTKCRRCVVACKEAGYQAIEYDEKADFPIKVIPERCTGCGLCFVTCKDGAVEIRSRVS
jgi:dihydropyrimidine dehydrogenase (NAD+) subunit PreA